MDYYFIEPDVAVSLGDGTILDTSTHPPGVRELHVVLEDWFGDALLEVFPCFLFQKELSEAIAKAQLEGVKFSDLAMTQSEEFLEQFPDLEVPTFFWGRVIGEPDVADFFLASDHRLVVSERALDLLKSFDISRAKIEPFSN